MICRLWNVVFIHLEVLWINMTYVMSCVFTRCCPNNERHLNMTCRFLKLWCVINRTDLDDDLRLYKMLNDSLIKCNFWNVVTLKCRQSIWRKPVSKVCSSCRWLCPTSCPPSGCMTLAAGWPVSGTGSGSARPSPTEPPPPGLVPEPHRDRKSICWLGKVASFHPVQ